MKLLGISCGRKMGNSEIMLKEALMAGEELGANVELIRLVDLDIKPCLHCLQCPWNPKGPSGCIHKDDAPFLWDKIMDSDGLIISSPVYTLTPPALLLNIRDRILGPKADIAFIDEYKKAGNRDIRFNRQAFVDERIFKARPGGFISIGGAPYHDWVTLAIPLLHTLTFSMQIEIIDQIQIVGAGAPGAILLKEEALERAKILGRNVAQAMGKKRQEMKYIAKDQGLCPSCHLKLFVIIEKNQIMCPICGIKGKLKIHDGEITPLFSEEEQKRSRLTIEGKRIHFFEILDVFNEFQKRANEIPERLKRYESYKPYVSPPSKIIKNKN